MMSDNEQDDTWEDFFGSSPDLMPSIMGAMDALLDSNKDPTNTTPTGPVAYPKRVYQAANFTNLSANVQKILSNVPDEEISNNNNNSNNIMNNAQKRFSRITASQRSQRFLEKKSVYKSNETLEDIISPNVQKLLSNLPDDERTIVPFQCSGVNSGGGGGGEILSSGMENGNVEVHLNSSNEGCVSGELADSTDCLFNTSPLGSYMQKTPYGIASRTPVGRKHMGKFLQIPSENTNSTGTLSSEVSRPVSLTSLGSCSSSGSSGLNQQGSAYLASAESLDSDVEPSGSQGSADSGIAESTTMSPELRVLHEVLDTETVYVQDLQQVIQGYLHAWRTDPECPLQQHLPHLFSNLEEIYEFNKSFLDQLKEADCDPSRTANVFLYNDSGFSVYTEYCTSYPRTMSILTELTRDEKVAVLFRERQMALGHALPLGSYLLKPVQRILKYHLLLQRLSKQCESAHKPTVDLALTTMTSVASHINTMKRKHEHAVRVQEIQSQLYGWDGADLTALGELIAEGSFRVGGARGRRHVLLFDKLLLMAKCKPDGALAYKTHIMCSNLMLVEQVRGEPLSFHVLPFDNPRNQCTLRARSSQHKREWTMQIKRVILENYKAVIPNHAKQLVMQLGQDVDENQEDQSSPIKQHSTPQYLERRSRVRKTNEFRRTVSHDRAFSTLTNWRRKSDPSGIQQYNTKTLPKKISKIKKAKECGTVFYTDLSDSENCDVIDASNDSLNGIEQTVEKVEERVNSSTIAQVVNDLLMQNEDFHKLLNRRRRNLRDMDNIKTTWNSSADDRLPNKSDSLPRSFQLNEQSDGNATIARLAPSESSTSLQDNLPKIEDLQETDVTSQIDDELPEHKIYRKSTIRFSLLQRFRAIISEEQKNTKFFTYKQGSKSIGARIAHPDYADPHKLFPSQLNIDNKTDLFECYELDRSDMTINENEVLREIDQRLQQQTVSSQNLTRSKSDTCASSQALESFYEVLLEKSLIEEEKKIDKSDSFRSTTSDNVDETLLNLKTRKYEIKRPTKAPPPVPTKPKHLNKLRPHTPTVGETSNKNASCSSIVICENFTNKGWVKSMVDRFE